MASRFELSKGCDLYESMARRNSESSEQIFDDIVNLSKEKPKRVVILLVGKSGAGKSAFVNTFYKAITGETHKIAKAGKGNAQSVTHKLVWYEHCGVENLGLIKDEQRRNAISECLENLPNIIDFAGLGDVDDENTRVILDRLFDGCIEPGTEATKLQDLQNLLGHDCLSRNRSPERVVTHVLFVQSWRTPVPIKLIECLAKVMGTLDEKGSTKYPVAETVLITRYDELVYPTNMSGNQPNNENDYEKCKDKLAENFCFVEATADNIFDWINYSDSIKADGRYPDNRNDVIDCNALKLLRRFLEPGVPIQHPTRSLVDWRMRVKIQANKIRHFRMEWVMAVVVVLCLLLLFFLIQAIYLPRDKENSNTTEHDKINPEQ